MASEAVVLIVGGGTGIGYAAAERFVRRGIRVAIAGRRDGVLSTARDKLRAIDPEIPVLATSGDAGAESEATRIVRSVSDEFGRLDYCVNCAGVYEPVDFLDMNGDAWQRTLSSTLDSVVHTGVAAANEMVKLGGGRFVLTSSVNAPLSEPESAHYSAAKAGVSSLARSMALDLAKHNIQVNAVAPGWVHTAMVDEFVQNATEETLSRLNIVGRVGQPDEVANVIEYLVLDAPDYLTATTLFVDGGQTAMAPLI